MRNNKIRILKKVRLTKCQFGNSVIKIVYFRSLKSIIVLYLRVVRSRRNCHEILSVPQQKKVENHWFGVTVNKKGYVTLYMDITTYLSSAVSRVCICSIIRARLFWAAIGYNWFCSYLGRCFTAIWFKMILSFFCLFLNSCTVFVAESCSWASLDATTFFL